MGEKEKGSIIEVMDMLAERILLIQERVVAIQERLLKLEEEGGRNRKGVQLDEKGQPASLEPTFIVPDDLIDEVKILLKEIEGDG